MFKKLKIAITTVAVALTATASAFGFAATDGFGTVKAEETKFLIDHGVYSLKMDEAVSEEVSYRHSESYLFNTRDTDGDIRLKFKTVSVSTELDGEDFYGLVRGKSEDVAYAYADTKSTMWYVFGTGNPGIGNVTVYREGAYTDIKYDTSSHAFGVTIDGQDQSAGMNKFVGSAEGKTADEKGATKICWDVTNTKKEIDVTLTDFAITDAEGFDLGMELSPRASVHENKRFETTFYGFAGKKVTFKRFDESEKANPSVTDTEGNALDIAITAEGKGVYSFVMPEQDIKIEEYKEIEDDRFFGTYYNEQDKTTYFLGEENYKIAGTVKTELSVKAYDVGVLAITDGENLVNGRIVYGNLRVSGKIYKKLLSYTVSFVVDGKTEKTVKIDSGDYVLTAPDLTPAKEGYTFVGWKTGKNESYEFGNVVCESLTLYADFKSDGEHKDPAGGCGGSFSAGNAGIVVLAAGALAVLIKVFGKKVKKEI